MKTRQRVLKNPNALDLMADLRLSGWCVILKVLPLRLGRVLEESRSEYDTGNRKRLKSFGKGRWYCEAQWMGEEYKPSQFGIGNTADQAVNKVWWEING